MKALKNRINEKETNPTLAAVPVYEQITYTKLKNALYSYVTLIQFAYGFYTQICISPQMFYGNIGDFNKR